MPSSFQLTLIGALVVAMATAAPLSNQEKLVNLDQAEGKGTRAKRAEEEIVFGNQQNKARVMAKKSDLSNVVVPASPQGEEDVGAEVVVHKEVPVEEDLAARAAAAMGKDENEKIAQAVEAAMQTVERVAEGAEEAEEAEAHEEEAAHTEKQVVVDSNGNTEVTEVVEDTHEDDEEDEDLKDLKAATTGSSESSTSSEGSSDAATDASADGDAVETPVLHDDDVKQFLEEIQKQGEKNGVDLGLQGLANDKDLSDYYRHMYQYMMSPYGGRDNLQRMPYLYYRRRRSLANARKAAASHRGQSRRIKRDLLDDGYYDTYSPYSSMENEDALLADPDEYVPLTDDEAEYLYKRLLNYLASINSDEMETPYDEVAVANSPYGYAEDFSEPLDEPYAPYDIYNTENMAEMESQDDEGYPYGPVDLDTYNNYAKRSLFEYYPRMEEEKRYFFPFNEEPETHWGAFVPEKRDYDEAIQRLQRLAMALSDNPGPYYKEMLEEYRKK